MTSEGHWSAADRSTGIAIHGEIGGGGGSGGGGGDGAGGCCSNVGGRETHTRYATHSLHASTEKDARTGSPAGAGASARRRCRRRRRSRRRGRGRSPSWKPACYDTAIGLSLFPLCGEIHPFDRKPTEYTHPRYNLYREVTRGGDTLAGAVTI